jgi:hypothetical protein
MTDAHVAQQPRHIAGVEDICNQPAASCPRCCNMDNES